MKKLDRKELYQIKGNGVGIATSCIGGAIGHYNLLYLALKKNMQLEKVMRLSQGEKIGYLLGFDFD